MSAMVSLITTNQNNRFTLEPSIKRDIGHLCHDEQRPKVQDKPLEPTAAVPAPSYTPGIIFFSFCFHSCIYCYMDFSRSICSTTTANFLVAYVHPPVFVSTRDVWKRIFDPDVCPLYRLLIFSPLPNFAEISWKLSTMAHSSVLQPQSALPLFLMLHLRIV